MSCKLKNYLCKISMKCCRKKTQFFISFLILYPISIIHTFFVHFYENKWISCIQNTIDQHIACYDEKVGNYTSWKLSLLLFSHYPPNKPSMEKTFFITFTTKHQFMNVRVHLWLKKSFHLFCFLFCRLPFMIRSNTLYMYKMYILMNFT